MEFCVIFYLSELYLMYLTVAPNFTHLGVRGVAQDMGLLPSLVFKTAPNVPGVRLCGF